MEQTGVDCTFELDDFNNPRLRDEAEMIKNIVLTILIMQPGQYASLPVIGMDIKNLLYAEYDNISEEEIENQLIEQCEALAQPIYEGDINVKKVVYRGMNSLVINVNTTNSDSTIRDAANNGAIRSPYGFYIGLSVNEINQLLYNVSMKTN